MAALLAKIPERRSTVRRNNEGVLADFEELLCRSSVVESYVLRLPKMYEQHSQ